MKKSILKPFLLFALIFVSYAANALTTIVITNMSSCNSANLSVEAGNPTIFLSGANVANGPFQCLTDPTIVIIDGYTIIISGTSGSGSFTSSMGGCGGATIFFSWTLSIGGTTCGGLSADLLTINLS